jgi:hypothetical protein
MSIERFISHSIIASVMFVPRTTINNWSCKNHRVDHTDVKPFTHVLCSEVFARKHVLAVCGRVHISYIGNMCKDCQVTGSGRVFIHCIIL